MKSFLLPIHLVAAGIWLGCVLTEALFERALLGKGRQQELLLAGLHKRVDLIVEIQAFLLVLATGLLLLPSAASSLLLQAKVAFGLIAIFANAYCVWLVFRRYTHASLGNWTAFERTDHIQHKWGQWCLLACSAPCSSGSTCSRGSDRHSRGALHHASHAPRPPLQLNAGHQT